MDNQPHNCGLVALSELFPTLSPSIIKEAFLFCCEKWPHSGVKKRDMNIVIRYLNLKNFFQYIDVSKEKISLQDLVKNTKKIYMVLVPYHYFIIKNGIIIDYSGEYYYQMKNKIAVHCYWEFRN